MDDTTKNELGSMLKDIVKQELSIQKRRIRKVRGRQRTKIERDIDEIF